MDATFKIPFYAKLALIAIGLFALLFVLHIGEFVIVPLVLALVAAIALNPLVNFFINKGMYKFLAILFSVMIFVLLLFATLYLVYMQLTIFSESYPLLLAKYDIIKDRFLQWASSNFDIPASKITAWAKEMQADTIRNFAFMDRFSDILQTFVILTLVPVYMFLILYYKPLLLSFLQQLFIKNQQNTVTVVLTNVKEIIQRYLFGIFLEVIIVAILNSAGLLILGIDFAILLGIIGAILNIIPYIGGIVSTALPMIIAFITKDSLSYPLMVLLLYLTIQLIDNNFVVPRIVASRVKLNALVSIPIVIIGGAIWGIPGMFLSIPLSAIAKVIFDHIDILKPWGYLLGNIEPIKPKFTFVKLTRKT